MSANHLVSEREGEGQPSLLSEKGGGEEEPLTSIREEEEEEEEEKSSLLRKKGGRRPTPSPLEQLGHDSFSDKEGKAKHPFLARKEAEKRGPSFLLRKR